MPRRKRRRNADVQLHIRLYPGQDDDLIDWLEQLDEQPFGHKGPAVKEALRRGIGGAIAAGAGSGPIAAAMPALDLAQMRQVVEAAIETALARHALAPRDEGVPGPVSIAAEDEEAEALLDALGDALVLRD